MNEVEKRIHKALRTGSKKLDLSDLTVRKIPNSFWELSAQLEELMVGNASFRKLPKEKKGFPHLKKVAVFDTWLSEVPAFGPSLEHLTYVHPRNTFTNNNLKPLVKSTSLKYLKLSVNSKENFLEVLRHLPSLEHLDISECSIHKEEYWEVLRHFSNLKSLKVQSQRLSERTLESICSLTQLKHLNLSQTRLTTLPESLGRLTQLESLVLDSNHLVKLPSFLNKLSGLKILSVKDNDLVKLPSAISALTQLEALLLSGNSLEKLPKSLSTLSQLKKIDISQNNLSSLPKQLWKLNKLEELNVEDNFIESYSKKLSQIKNFNIQNNPVNNPQQVGTPLKLKAAEQNIEQLVKEHIKQTQTTSQEEILTEILEASSSETPYLNLHYRKLKSLPPEIACLKDQITHLDLSYNWLTQFPEVLFEFKNLRYLDLSGNQFELPPSFLKKLPSLKYLEFYDNLDGIMGIECLKPDFNIKKALESKVDALAVRTSYRGRAPLTYELTLLSPYLKNIYSQGEPWSSERYLLRVGQIPTFIGEFKKLKRLSLLVSYSTEIPVPNSLWSLENLEELALEFKYGEIPLDGIGNLSNLKKLYLSGCDNIPEDIGNLSQLEVLVLKGVKNLSPAIWQLKNLKCLFLKEVSLTEIPDEIHNLKHLEVFSLDNTDTWDSTEKWPDEEDTPKLLMEVSNNIGNLRSLRSLTISGNLLMELPSTIGNLTQLEKIDFSKNIIAKIPDSVANLKKATWVALAENDFAEDSEELLKFPIFQNLDTNKFDLFEEDLSIDLEKEQVFWEQFPEDICSEHFVDFSEEWD